MWRTNRGRHGPVAVDGRTFVWRIRVTPGSARPATSPMADAVGVARAERGAAAGYGLAAHRRCANGSQLTVRASNVSSRTHDRT
jgi:hypothetical protein